MDHLSTYDGRLLGPMKPGRMRSGGEKGWVDVVTARNLMSVGLALLGISTGLDALTVLSGPLTMPGPRLLGYASALATALLVFILPAVIMLRYRQAWAARLVPDDPVESVGHIQPEALLHVGLVLLGFYFLVWGAGLLISGLLLFVTTTGELSGRELLGATEAIAGLAIITFGRRRKQRA